MMLNFVCKTTFLLALVAANKPEGDELQLLQVAMNSKAKQLTSKSESVAAEAMGKNSCSSLTTAEDIPNMLFMDDKGCSSGSTFVQMPSDVAKTESEVEPVPDATEEAKASASRFEETITVVLRYLLNFCTCAVCMDILRSLVRKVSEQNSHTNINYAVDDSEELHTAAKDGSVADVERLLDSGSNVNELDDWEDTPLHHAARAGTIDVCELLVSRGACIDAKNVQGWTPLLTAGSAGKRAMCEWLLSRGATQGGLEESSLPAMVQTLLAGPEQVEPEILTAQAESEADLIRRVLQPKPEWEQLESMPDWDLEDDDFVPTSLEQ